MFISSLFKGKTYKQFKLNCGNLPKKDSQIIHIYNTWVLFEKYQDQKHHFLIDIRKQNNLAILQKYQQQLQKIIQKLRFSNLVIKNPEDIKKIDTLINNQIQQKYKIKKIIDALHQNNKQTKFQDKLSINQIKNGEVFLTYLMYKFKDILFMFQIYYQLKDKDQLKPFNQLSLNLWQSYKKQLMPSLFNSVYKSILKRKQTHNLQFQNQKQQQKTSKLAQKYLYKHNKFHINKQAGLCQQHFIAVQTVLDQLRNKKNYWDLNNIFTEQQKQIIIQILRKAQSNDQQCLKQDSSRLFQFLRKFQKIQTSSSQPLNKTHFKITPKSNKQLSLIDRSQDLPNIFYLIVMLYRYFQNIYSPSSRRLLLNVCHLIQQDYKALTNGYFCLVHVLKILQSQKIRVPKKQQDFTLYDILTNQSLYRQSQLSLENEKISYFHNYSNIRKTQINDAQNLLKEQLKKINSNSNQEIKLELLKLSHSKYRKNVTILINGFLSQNTDNFKQWMGVLDSIYDSQIYAINWSASDVDNMLQFSKQVLKDGLIWGLGHIVGFIKPLVDMRDSMNNHFEKNPFTQCFEKAQLTGKVLADLLIKVFDGHFINLMGFSLGTQLIYASMQRFKQRNKLHMINKVITMGGVADKQNVYKHMRNVQQYKQNPISIIWTNLHCDNDRVLKNVLPLTKPSIKPVGLNPLIQIKTNQTYKIKNYDVTQFIQGHLDYRDNIRMIARLIGFKDQ